MMSLTVTGVPRVREAIRRAPRSRRDAVNAVIERYVALIVREAKGLAPVDTGRLRATIRTELEALQGRVLAGGTDTVDYARFVELGTRKAPAQPFLFPAFEMHRAAFVREVTRAAASGRPGEGR